METPTTNLPSLAELGYLEEPAAEAFIGVKKVTLRNWRAAGSGPPFTKVHGNRIVYPVAGLKAWLEARTVRPAGTPSLIHGRKRRGASARP